MDTRIEVRRQAFGQARTVADPDAPAARPLADGEVRLRVTRFALTANNVTYAAFGDAMKYWQFFPASDPAWGCVPVWGFADVCESRAEGIAVGEHLYGYLPMGRHLVICPGTPGRTGFSDRSPHRAGLAAVYNRYERCASDPAWSAEREGLQAVLRPLFTTAFLIDDALAEQAFHGAGQLLLSSASSKTAWSTVFCLAQRRGQPGMPTVVGLTSARHVEYTQRLGCYDRVLAYEALPTLDAAVPAVYVDFSGDAGLRAQVHQRWGDGLKHSAAIGGTHWQALGAAGDARSLPGPRPTLFFAPAQIARRAGPPPDGWGPGGLAERLGSAWQALVAQVDAPGAGWLTVTEAAGAEACRAAWQALVAGDAVPRDGLMFTP